MKVAKVPIIPYGISPLRNNLRSVLTVRSDAFDSQRPALLGVNVAIVLAGALNELPFNVIVAETTGGSWSSTSGPLEPVEGDAVSSAKWGQIAKGAYFYGSWVGLYEPLSEPVAVSSGIHAQGDFYSRSRFRRRWTLRQAPRITQLSIFLAPRKSDTTVGTEPLVGGSVLLGFTDGT